MKKLIATILTACAISGFAQNVNIPDAKFKATLVRVGVDANKDGEIQVIEAEAVKELQVVYSGIQDLTGIEAFVNLTKLECRDNSLTSLDVSKNTALTELICYSNKLTSLDVSKNTALKVLDCNWNLSLASLDVSNNTALTELRCAKNQLTSLDVSNNTALTKLICDENQLISLNVSKNIALTYLACGSNQLTNLDVRNNTAISKFYWNNNPKLKVVCINTDQVHYTLEPNNWSWSKDANVQYSTTCEMVTAIQTETPITAAKVIKAYNLQGVEVSINTKNQIVILLYDNGQTQKVFVDL